MPLISKYLSLIFSVPPIGVRRFWPYHLHPRKEWVRGRRFNPPLLSAICK